MQAHRPGSLVAVIVLAVAALGACAPYPAPPRVPGNAPAAERPDAEQSGAGQPDPGPIGVPPAVAADRAAGLLDRVVPRTGTGPLKAVPGSSPAPHRTRIVPLRVEVEQGVHVDPERFAAFVMTTLNDARSWGRDGSVGFARTAGPAPLQVVLTSPATTDRLCAPLETDAPLSCRSGPRAVINALRWTSGTPEYASDLTAYRHYVVNHEVGHWLGHSHVPCPGPGRPAPVMQQQTLGLDGCTRNSWPGP